MLRFFVRTERWKEGKEEKEGGSGRGGQNGTQTQPGGFSTLCLIAFGRGECFKVEVCVLGASPDLIVSYPGWGLIGPKSEMFHAKLDCMSGCMSSHLLARCQRSINKRPRQASVCQCGDSVCRNDGRSWLAVGRKTTATNTTCKSYLQSVDAAWYSSRKVRNRRVSTPEHLLQCSQCVLLGLEIMEQTRTTRPFQGSRIGGPGIE